MIIDAKTSDAAMDHDGHDVVALDGSQRPPAYSAVADDAPAFSSAPAFNTPPFPLTPSGQPSPPLPPQTSYRGQTETSQPGRHHAHASLSGHTYGASPPHITSPALSPQMQEAFLGSQYQNQLMARCARGDHDTKTEYGVCGIITAVICFPIGLICLFTDRETKCARCGVRLD